MFNRAKPMFDFLTLIGREIATSWTEDVILVGFFHFRLANLKSKTR